MSALSFRIETFDPQTTSDAVWEQYFIFSEKLFKERNPDDPPPPRNIIKGLMLDPEPNFERFHWLIFAENDQLIGAAVLSFTSEQSPDYKTNKHAARGQVEIDEAHRRQGVGSEILKTLVVKAKEYGKIILQGGTDFESGRKFCEKFNGVVVLEGKESRLYLHDADWRLIDTWRKEGPKRAVGVTIETHRTVPEEDIEDFANLVTEVINQQPRGELEGIEFTYTPDRIRADEKRFEEKGFLWIIMVSREKDGALSGLTDVRYLPEEPDRVHILFTGVREMYRGRGLGKWLKSEMMLHLQETYPDLKYIATENASTNAPMLSINERLGYKEYRRWRAYKFHIQDLCERLGI